MTRALGAEPGAPILQPVASQCLCPHLENGDGACSHLRRYCRFMGHLVPEKCLAQSKHIISPSSPSERVQVKWLLSVRIKIKVGRDGERTGTIWAKPVQWYLGF